MADLSEADYGTAYYRSRDPIKNIRLRVRLRKATTTTAVPQMVQIRGAAKGGDSVELQNLKQQKDNIQNPDEEVYEFSWQEKVFSQREVDKYSQADQCLTVLERKYHTDVLPLKEKGRPTKRLFTYVDHDSYTNSDECRRRVTNSPTEQPTQLAEKMETVRHRRNAASNRNDKKPTTIVSKNNIVIKNPSEELKKKNRLVSAAVQTMYIMADLAPVSRPSTVEDEMVLCVLKVDSCGVLSIRPDFNKGRQPYKVGGGLNANGRELCQYTLEHASSQLSRQEQEKEFKMYREMYARHADFLSMCVGQSFELPPPRVLRLVVHGEIVSAQDFEYDNLYIRWFIDLPNDWVPNGNQTLSGVTQTSITKTKGRSEVAYFSYPFSFDLLYVGDVHENQGSKTETLHCWRPAGRSFIADMRRFFIGGSPELEDPMFVAVPSAFEATHLSKFGFQTKSTGSVTIKVQTILQSQVLMHATSIKRTAVSLAQKIGFATTASTMLNVLESFQNAKRRMVAARENLKADYIKTLGAYNTTSDA